MCIQPQSMFRAKIRKISEFFQRKFQFLQLKKSLNIAWASFCNVYKNLSVDFGLLGIPVKSLNKQNILLFSPFLE